MTFREKLKQEHPECVRPSCMGGCASCPYIYGYEDRNDRPCRSKGYSCTDCWNRTIPGTEEPSVKPDLNALIERAATKKDISLMIHINGDDTTISVYPCPDPSEKKGNPVAEAYRILVNSGYKTVDMERAIDDLGEALE